MARLIAYARKSDPSEKDRTSLDEQITRIKKFAEACGHTVVCAYKESYSGFSSIDDLKDRTTLKKGRRAFAKALDLIDSNFADGIIVFRLDRFSRNFKDNAVLFDHFKKTKKQLISVSEMFDIHTATGEMVAGILTVFAQHERNVIVDRLSRGKEAKQKHGGVVHGTSAYGCRHEKVQLSDTVQITVVKPDDKEQAVIAEITRLYEERMEDFRRSGMRLETYNTTRGGIWGYIAKYLNEKGIKSKRGKKWASSSVRYIIFGQCDRRKQVQAQITDGSFGSAPRAS